MKHQPNTQYAKSKRYAQRLAREAADIGAIPPVSLAQPQAAKPKILAK